MDLVGRADPVVVVGAGIAGVSCARELAAAGVPVRLLDRGRRPGGRMAVHRHEGRVADVGASYLTAADPAFAEVVRSWQDRGLARPWTSALASVDADGVHPPDPDRDGPVRWAAPGGLRVLVDDLADGLTVETGRTVERVHADGGRLHVDAEPAAAVVLAMPDPQAARLLDPDGPAGAAAADRAWLPVLALAAGWPHRAWPALRGAFVDDPDVSFVADDGDRRGDGAPVLVVHSTPDLAERHLADPAGATAPLLSALERLLGLRTAPTWTHVHRWTFARPADGRDAPFHLGPDLVGLCGDGWAERSRVEAAFLSGRALGRELVSRLA